MSTAKILKASACVVGAFVCCAISSLVTGSNLVLGFVCGIGIGALWFNIFENWSWND